ncbi:MAG TPA: peptide ABC transporter substrate-binding protein, partial [Pyrinomonadaceae bacterium]|nr:peptide ABC transporter substrate-binding protein [Pyrinomonadaceae bacterium]
ETDVVRAIFEGLTEIDSKTLDAVPAAAEKWSASDDKRVWTFQLRKDARWSNNKHVTADDFVTSWQRLGTLGEKTAHRELIQNIVGLKTEKPELMQQLVDSPEFQHAPPKGGDPNTANLAARLQEPHPAPLTHAGANAPHDETDRSKQKEPVAQQKFGVEAVSDSVLQITLELPDKDFPKLVANPIFRPIYGDGAEFETDPLDTDVVTNGAFTVADADKNGVALDRSDTYWNKAAVKLEHIRLVPKDTAEAALDAYKKGEIDAVTNAEFEPLALKLLSPYEDFRQTTHSALNFYEFNTRNAPFNDRRVREALATAIDRDRLSDGELEGATQPANVFLPLGSDHTTKLTFDAEKARALLDKAGYPGGEHFPQIRLVINRNDTQQRVARTVARMWKQNLNLETQIIVKESADIEAVKTSGEFDLIRRGVVLPTADELVSLASVFGTAVKTPEPMVKEPKAGELPLGTQPETLPPPGKRTEKGGPSDTENIENAAKEPAPVALLTEDDAIYELNAIPLYFPMSYSLVKPYVKGFEMNGFDALSLRDVTIDSNWQPKTPRGE